MIRQIMGRIEDSSPKTDETGPSERKPKMRFLAWLLLPLLAASPLLAKPKVDVRIKINEEIAKDRAQDSLSKNTGSSLNTTFYGTVFFLNVIVLSDNAEAVAKNHGNWCISGDIELDRDTEYHGTLNGNDLNLEIPQKNGKIKKVTFEIFDHKWRKLSDITRLLDLPPASAGD
jgi:hypothetical protein